MAKSKQTDDEARAKAVSLLYDDMEEGGGLLNDVIVTITKATFERSNYGGKSTTYRPAAHLVIEEDDGTVYDDQFWSCGKDTDWTPSDCGKFLYPMGAKMKLSKSSNFGIFIKSLIENNFPKDKVDVDITFLEGLKFHLRQQAVEGRDKVKSKDGSKEYDATVACVAEIVQFPWEKPAKGAAKGKPAAAKGKAKEAATESATDGVSPEDATVGFVMGALAANPEGVSVANLPTLLLKAKNAKELDVDEKVANKMIQLIFKQEWMNADDRPWSVDGGVVKMGE